MAYDDLVRSHVERCLQDIWELSSLELDGEGDYPFRSGSCVGWVTVETQRPKLVRVIMHAAYGVKQSAALLRELNTINSRARFASVSWSAGVVTVQWALAAESFDRASLHLALDTVTTVANDIAELISTVFGGQVPLPAAEQAG
jgi:hypothetical protein